MRLLSMAKTDDHLYTPWALFEALLCPGSARSPVHLYPIVSDASGTPIHPSADACKIAHAFAAFAVSTLFDSALCPAVFQCSARDRANRRGTNAATAKPAGEKQYSVRRQVRPIVH